MPLTKNVIFGAIWLVSARLGTRVLDLVSMLVMARLLVPGDFGLIALAASVVLILNAVTDLSLANAIIQMKDPQRAAYDTAFTLGILRGAFLFFAISAAAWPFSGLYQDDRLFAILCVLALIPALQGARSPRMMHFQRELQFHQTFYMETVAKTVAIVASISLAVLTQSYWAIVAGMVVFPLITTLFSYYLAPYRPRFGLQDWRKVFSFSSWIALAGIVNTLNFQADRFFIGGKLGTSLLGQYSVGSDLAALPTNAPLMPIMQSLYAGFAKLSGDIDRLQGAYLTSQCILLALALPIAISVSVLAYPIVYIAVGTTWAPAAFVVQVLAPVFAFQMLTAPAQSVAMALGETKGIFYRDILGLAVRLPLIVMAVYFGGLTEVVWARVFSGLFIIVPNLLMIRRLLRASFVGQLFAPWRSYVSGIVLACTLLTLSKRSELLDRSDLDALPALVGVTAVGFVCYAGVHFLLWAIKRPDNSIEARLIRFAKSCIADRHRIKPK